MSFNYKHRPVCTTCRKEGVLADAGILSPKPYYYCRICKIELDYWGCEVLPETPPSKFIELDNYLAEHSELEEGASDGDAFAWAYGLCGPSATD